MKIYNIKYNPCENEKNPLKITSILYPPKVTEKTHQKYIFVVCCGALLRRSFLY